MKVLTYNVHGWLTGDGELNIDRVAGVLNDSGADVIGLNEVFSSVPGDSAAFTTMADRLGFYSAFGATHSSDPSKHPPYGNAILSRWPIVAHAAHHLDPQTSYGRRGLLEARVLLPSGEPFTVYVTHLDHRSEQIRLEQWSAAMSWLQRERGRPHLVMGDFNALAAGDYPTGAALDLLAEYQQAQGWVPARFDLIVQVLKAGYIDVQAGQKRAPTFPAHAPERRIDYIFAPPVMAGRMSACRALETRDTAEASDHLPVFADFAFPDRE